MKNLIDVDYDKFADKRVTTTKPMQLIGEFYRGEPVTTFDINIRHLSMPQDDSLLLDIEYSGGDWVFLRWGYLIININNVENIKLKANESWHDHDVIDGGCKCEESCYYVIDQETLKKICDADTIDVKIQGEDTDYECNANEFILYAQYFYNSVYDSEAYKDIQNKSINLNPNYKELTDNMGWRERNPITFALYIGLGCLALGIFFFIMMLLST